jgi:hypothetical protein
MRQRGSRTTRVRPAEISLNEKINAMCFPFDTEKTRIKLQINQKDYTNMCIFDRSGDLLYLEPVGQVKGAIFRIPKKQRIPGKRQISYKLVDEPILFSTYFELQGKHVHVKNDRNPILFKESEDGRYVDFRRYTDESSELYKYFLDLLQEFEDCPCSKQGVDRLEQSKLHFTTH